MRGEPSPCGQGSGLRHHKDSDVLAHQARGELGVTSRWPRGADGRPHHAAALQEGGVHLREVRK